MPPSPENFDAAAAWFQTRIPITDEEFGGAVEELLGDRAFRIAGLSQLSLVNDVWQALDRAISQGTTLEDFKAEVEDKLTAAWGKAQPHRVETIFRNWVQKAYAAGREDVMGHPVVRQFRPYARYVAILDSRTTDICAPLHGVVRRIDDGWWNGRIPPLHHRCRSTRVTLTEEEAIETGITPTPPPVTPAPGFGAPPDFPSEPDLSKYPPELLNILERKRAA